MYFSLDKDTIPDHIDNIKKHIKNIFFMPEQWNKTYDFIEFIYKYQLSEDFLIRMNEVLEQENSAYRLSKA